MSQSWYWSQIKNFFLIRFSCHPLHDISKSSNFYRITLMPYQEKHFSAKTTIGSICPPYWFGSVRFRETVTNLRLCSEVEMVRRENLSNLSRGPWKWRMDEASRHGANRAWTVQQPWRDASKNIYNLHIYVTEINGKARESPGENKHENLGTSQFILSLIYYVPI